MPSCRHNSVSFSPSIKSIVGCLPRAALLAGSEKRAVVTSTTCSAPAGSWGKWTVYIEVADDDQLAVRQIDRCVQESQNLPSPLLTCWPVLTEAAWLLRQHPGAIERLLSACDEGLLTFVDLPQDSLPTLAAFLKKYRRLGVQLAHAALVYLANEASISTIFTLDRRDFTVFRTNRNKPFTLIPKHP